MQANHTLQSDDRFCDPSWPLALLPLISLALYFRTRGFEFIQYDDPLYVCQNWHVQTGLTLENIRWALTSVVSSNWHPLTMLLELGVAQIFGTGPAAFHLLNALIHSINTLLLYLLLRRTTGQIWPAVLAAALWAWHPLRVESVAWISELKDVLCGCFYLSALLAYVSYLNRPGVWRYARILIFVALALTSKPMAVTLPIAMLLLQIWPLRGFGHPWKWWVNRLAEQIPPLLLCIITAGICVYTQTVTGATGWVKLFTLRLRIENALVSTVTYIGKNFVPRHLGIFYPHPAMIQQTIPASHWISAAAILVLITCTVTTYRHRAPYLLMGWLWFLLTLIPVIGLVQVGEQSMADRYSYLPSIGLISALVYLAAELTAAHPRFWILSVAFAATFAVFFLILSYRQITCWRQNITLLTHSNEVTPDNYLIQITLADISRRAGNYTQAMHWAQLAVKTAPAKQGAHHELASVLQATGQPVAALHEYQAAVQLDRFDPFVRNDLGGLLVQQNDNADAIKQFERAVSINPDFVEARHNLAVLLASQGNYDEAIKQWEQALYREPGNGNYHGWIAEALRLRNHTGDREAAIVHYRAAINAGEKKAAWEINYSWLVATDPASTPRSIQTVIPVAKDAVAATGNSDPLALDALAAAQARDGEFDDAVTTAGRAHDRASAANQPALAKAIEARMMQYRAGEPYISPR